MGFGWAQCICTVLRQAGLRDAQPIPTAQPFGVQPLRPQQHPRLPPAPPAGFAVPADVVPVGVFWPEQWLLTRAGAQHRNLSALPAVAGGAERCHMQVAKHTPKHSCRQETVRKATTGEEELGAMFALKQRFKAEVLAVLNSNRNGCFYEVPGTWRALFYFIFKLMLGTGTECDVNRLQDSVHDILVHTI